MPTFNVPSQADLHPRTSPSRSPCSGWPIGPAAIAALVDLSMSDEKIARYFGVTANEVADARRKYGLKQDGEGRRRHD